MLDAVLQDGEIRDNANTFEDRFGLRSDEPLIRIRVLDPNMVPTGWPAVLNDLTVPRTIFRRLCWPAERALIVENKLTFLTLPSLSKTLAIWGAGNAVGLLSAAEWLKASDLWYWGDLDVAGFNILNRLRRKFPKARSVFMDAATLDAYRTLAIRHCPSVNNEIDLLTNEECAICAELRQNQIRLEQEKLPHAWILERFQQLSWLA